MSTGPDFHLIVDSTRNGVISTDIQGRITYLNQAAEKTLGFTFADVMQRQITAIMPITGKLVVKCLNSRESQLGRHIIGRNVALVVNVTIMEKDGDMIGAVCVFQDMREFEETARQLQSHIRLNNQLKAIFDSSSDGIWVCDSKGNVIDVNQASEHLNGVRADEIIDKNVVELIRTNIFDRSITLDVLKTKKQASAMQYIKRTGKHILVTGTPAFGRDGKLFLVVVNERDMTQLNTLREELENNQMVTAKIRDELAELSLLELHNQQIIAESEAMKQVLRTALKLARLHASNILLLGESGTGKGLLAKFIHEKSCHKKMPFVQINCAALPETLLEAELFGYEKGAFTGACEHGKAGLIELAHEGTLFLDEIGDMPLSIQAKLLKYLDDHEVLRLGGLKSRKIDCVIIAATNRDLEELVKNRRFRRDLLYRLNAFTLRLPPLRERCEDILELCRVWLANYCKKFGVERRFAPGALDALLQHDFPGNIRELKGIIKKAVVMSDTVLMDANVLYLPQSQRLEQLSGPGKIDFSAGLTECIDRIEKHILKKAIRSCKTTRQLASALRISQPTVVRKLKKHGLVPH